MSLKAHFIRMTSVAEPHKNPLPALLVLLIGGLRSIFWSIFWPIKASLLVLLISAAFYGLSTIIESAPLKAPLTIGVGLLLLIVESYVFFSIDRRASRDVNATAWLVNAFVIGSAFILNLLLLARLS